MQRCPWVDDAMIDPRASRLRIDQLLALRKELIRGQFDLVYDLQNNARTSLYYRWMNTAWSGRAAGFDHLEYRKEGKSALESLAAQLTNAGVVARHALTPDVSWAADDVGDILRRASVARGFVLLIPGSSARRPGKRWPHYSELAHRLIADGLQVVTAPGPDELGLCRGIPGVMLLDRGQPLSIFQLVGLGRQVGFVIGNDTGPSHLMAHSGAKGLALFGSHAPAAATHIDRRFAILQVDRLDELTVDAVHAAYRRLSMT